MKQQLVELERIHFSRVFPWGHLFRAFRLALDIRKMILGALAVLVIYGGLAAFSYLPLEFAEAEVQAVRTPPWELRRSLDLEAVKSASGYWNDVAGLLAFPALAIWQPATDLVVQPLNWSGVALRWTQILWSLCLWSFFGTAISRMVAVQFAADQRVSLKEAAAFAWSKWLWGISAPLMPLAGLLGLWFGCVVFGWIGRIPGIGPVVLGVLWIIPLLLGLGILLLLIGLVLGWPLMVATIATQGSDAFDGFSRSFDYVYSRFWHLIWFLIVALIYGLLMLSVVQIAVSVIFQLAATFVGTGFGGEIFSSKDTFVGQSAAVWVNGVRLLVFGYAVSYFWSAGTIIYFLLRQSEDANHLSEVYLPKQDQSEDLVQLAGVAASDQPTVERPAKHQPETRQPEADSETGEQGGNG